MATVLYREKQCSLFGMSDVDPCPAPTDSLYMVSQRSTPSAPGLASPQHLGYLRAIPAHAG